MCSRAFEKTKSVLGWKGVSQIFFFLDAALFSPLSPKKGLRLVGSRDKAPLSRAWVPIAGWGGNARSGRAQARSGWRRRRPRRSLEPPSPGRPDFARRSEAKFPGVTTAPHCFLGKYSRGISASVARSMHASRPSHRGIQAGSLFDEVFYPKMKDDFGTMSGKQAVSQGRALRTGVSIISVIKPQIMI